MGVNLGIQNIYFLGYSCIQISGGLLTLFYGWVGGCHFSGYISQTVYSSLTKLSDIFHLPTKLSDIFHLPIPLNLSLFGARSHVQVSHRRLREADASRRKCLKTRFLGQNTPLKLFFTFLSVERQIYMQKYNFFVKQFFF